MLNNNHLLSGRGIKVLKFKSYSGLFYRISSTYFSKFLSHFLYNSKALSESFAYCTVLAPIIAVETFLFQRVQAIDNYD